MFFGGKKDTLYGSTKRNGHRSRRALLLGRPGQKSGDFDYKLMVTEQPKVNIEKFIRCRELCLRNTALLVIPPWKHIADHGAVVAGWVCRTVETDLKLRDQFLW
jgi:hypothetical protein